MTFICLNLVVVIVVVFSFYAEVYKGETSILLGKAF